MLDPVQVAMAPSGSIKSTVEPPIRPEASTTLTRESSHGSSTRLRSDQARRLPRSGACGEAVRSIATQGGVAILPAVANLTVKTNIRTARRGTLGGARDSPTMQANLRGCRACENLAAYRSYVRTRKIRQNFPAMRKSGANRPISHACLPRCTACEARALLRKSRSGIASIPDVFCIGLSFRWVES
jgi:hypothetical protein